MSSGPEHFAAAEQALTAALSTDLQAWYAAVKSTGAIPAIDVTAAGQVSQP